MAEYNLPVVGEDFNTWGTKLNNSVEYVKEQADAAGASAGSAVALATDAMNTADAATTSAAEAEAAAAAAQGTANAANTTAGNAQTTAGNAVTTANAAAATAASASTTATTAQSTANSASTAASGAVTTANTASTNATAAQGAVADLAEMLEDALDTAFSRPYLVTYGHSYLAETGISPASNYYARKTAVEWGMTYPTNSVTDDLKRAVGGSSAEASADVMLTGNPWSPSMEMGGNKVLLIQNMLNSSRVNGVNAISRQGAEHAIRSMVAIGSCREIIPDSATGFFTYAGSGTWSSVSDADFHGGAYRSNATDGAYVEFEVPAANCHFLTIGRKNGLATQTLEFRDMDRNVVIKTFVNFEQARSTITRNYVVAAIRLDVPAGTTVRVTKTAGSGIPLVADGLIVPHERPGPIVLVKDPYLANYSLSETFPNGSDAALDSFNSLYDLMATEFPNVIVVDPNTAGFWDKNTHLLPDGVHANTAGNEALFQSVKKHVREKMYIKAFQSGMGL